MQHALKVLGQWMLVLAGATLGIIFMSFIAAIVRFIIWTS